MGSDPLLHLFLLLVTFEACLTSAPGKNLLKNGDFEEGSRYWKKCWDFKCDITSECHSGSKAMKVTSRTMYYQGPRQTVHLEMAKRYSVDGWIKLLNDNDKPIQHVEIQVAETLSGDRKKYQSVARKSFLSTKNGWVHLAGDFVTPFSGLSSVEVYVEGPDPGISFIVDDMSVREIPETPNWKAEANERIEKLRKADIHFHIKGGSEHDPNNIRIEINQTSSTFAFGTAIDSSKITSSSAIYRKYTQFVYDNFEWATPNNALKWYEFERNRGDPNWSWGEPAIKELVKHGIKVRATNMLWSVERYVPSWLRSLSVAKIREEVSRHVKETSLRYKGLVEHWDVSNELLHGTWYENKLNDIDYTKEVFKQVHQWDPTVKLFLNEYGAFGGGGSTDAYAEVGADYKESGTHIYGLGLQSYFPDMVAPDPTVMMKRLDRLAEAGLSLWATELHLKTSDVNQRADWYETAMRVLFSHTAVDGIMLWGFWSENGRDGEDAALVSGPELTVNTAGKRYLNLVKDEWRTSVVRPLSSGKDFTLRGFLGDYKVNVRVDGNIVKTQTFTLVKGGRTVNINIE